MSDKLRRTFPIDIIIGTGEQPSSTKISAISSQSRNALNIVEKAVGDIWNQSGDGILAPGGSVTNAILAVNLARALGQQQFLSPRVPAIDGVNGIVKYKDTITARDGVAGNNETQLKYRPIPAGASLVSGDFTVGTVAPVGALTTYRNTVDLVEAAGDWHVSAEGKLFTLTKITSAELTYKPDLIADVDDTAQATVIPDPFTNGATFNGLKLSFANDTDNTLGYWLYLPPRRPLVAGRKIATSPNETGNEVDPTGPDRYFFQGTAFNAASDPHYRYKFPAEIQNILDGASPLQLPDNFMYLMDRNTGTIIEGLTFSVDTAAPHLTLGRFVVKVQGAKLDEVVASDPTLVTTKATETSAAYKNRFFLICPGNSSTRAVSAAIGKSASHAHTGTDGSQGIQHKHLLGLWDNNTVSFGPSSFKGDDHPQYLHREGRSDSRDFFRNGLRGDLLLLSTTAGGSSDYYHVAADSNKIVFGTTAKSLHYDQANDALAITGADLRLLTANKRLEFNDATVYLDEARVKALVLGAQSTHVFGGSTTATSGSGGGTTSNVSFTVPAGLTADVSAVFTGMWNGTGSIVSGELIVAGLYIDGSGPASATTDVMARSGGGEPQAISCSNVKTNVAAGTRNVNVQWTDSVTGNVTLAGQITITVIFKLP